MLARSCRLSILTTYAGSISPTWTCLHPRTTCSFVNIKPASLTMKPLPRQTNLADFGSCWHRRQGYSNLLGSLLRQLSISRRLLHELCFEARIIGLISHALKVDDALQIFRDKLHDSALPKRVPYSTTFAGLFRSWIRK